jgi:hypothetical protein
MQIPVPMLVVVFGSTLAFCQQPRLVNGHPQQRSAKQGLAAIMRELSGAAAQSAWAGYSVPSIPGEHQMCCFGGGHGVQGSCCGSCRLDGHDSNVISDSSENCQATLSNSFFVFLHLDHGRTEEVRMFSPGCTIDAQGATVYWLTDVQRAQSVEYLASLLSSRGEGRRHHDGSDGIIAAIAMHADAAADRMLETWVQTGHPEEVRSQAAFWIGNTRGNRGLDILLPLIRSDSNDEFLDQAIFAISQSSEKDRAFKELIQLARHDSRTHVREQALFWLAQEAGNKAAGAITDAVENDPETEVKKKAVFALSELPNDEGVPLLIEQARKNPNPVVRKEAVFWLGQSEDQRAVDFIASILER